MKDVFHRVMYEKTELSDSVKEFILCTTGRGANLVPRTDSIDSSTMGSLYMRVFANRHGHDH